MKTSKCRFEIAWRIIPLNMAKISSPVARDLFKYHYEGSALLLANPELPTVFMAAQYGISRYLSW